MVEAFQDQGNLPAVEIQEPSMRDDVRSALEEGWGIDSTVGPHVARLKRNFGRKRELPEVYEMITVSEGNLTAVTTPEVRIEDPEEAKSLAKLAAPGLLRSDVRKKLQKEGVGKLSASIIASFAAGATIESIAKEHGLKPDRVQENVEVFLDVSQRKKEGESQLPYFLNHVLVALGQLEKPQAPVKGLLKKLNALSKIGSRTHADNRFFSLTDIERRIISGLGFDLSKIRPIGTASSEDIMTLLPLGSPIFSGGASIVDLNPHLDGTEFGGRLVLIRPTEDEISRPTQASWVIGLLRKRESDWLLGQKIKHFPLKP